MTHAPASRRHTPNPQTRAPKVWSSRGLTAVLMDRVRPGTPKPPPPPGTVSAI